MVKIILRDTNECTVTLAGGVCQYVKRGQEIDVSASDAASLLYSGFELAEQKKKRSVKHEN